MCMYGMNEEERWEKSKMHINFNNVSVVEFTRHTIYVFMLLTFMGSFINNGCPKLAL